MYAVAGEAAANVAGVSLEQLVHDKIFKPLGLSNIGFSMAEMSKNKNFAMPNYANSYEDAVAGRFIETPLDAPAKMIAVAGDMYVTVLDLVR
jgi:CubicO group peptidase (beta-lactamase class C family)